ncbi:hypothetical protein P171DRAFT_432940 [Karstenula rhodostoma CBS 690.94]|uniref:WD40 repeat-like protein n=1 Tax=Karstenula rhodostoma CBS 690.94 TaxID=1392251 RepID=A0A9P4UB57_9PLEO|nr:hypothetical protein P171DRAFT_432940 [Karstenula rhodostoma CBS 690.94]
MHQPISLVHTGTQDGYHRFPLDPPIVKHWRCDLTALSHSYNLYFVACNDELYIYSPSFPSQDLGDPVILTVPSLGRQTPPGIDITDPHSVTRICVEYLGNTEVLLVTCDDGDVVGFKVREIDRAIIYQRDSPGRDNTDVAHEFRCFEHFNVDCSAWGLAVHRNARLIAISANTHLVKVKAYGLSLPDDGENDFPFPRNRNRSITLRAQTNIPAVSFDNTGGDPTGRWLCSSSIDGLTHLWDLSRPNQPARVIAVGHCASVSNAPDLRVLLGFTIEGPSIPESCKCSNRNSLPHAAWAAMFIDPRSCRHADSLSDACGVEVDTQGSVSSRGSYFWDITDETNRFAARRKSPIPTVPAVETTDGDQSASSEGSGQMSTDNESDDSVLHTFPTAAVEAPEQTIAETQQEQPIEGEEEPGTDLFAIPYSSPENQASLPPPLPSPGPAASDEESQSDSEDDTSTSGDYTADMRLSWSKKPYCAFITSNHHKEHSAELSTHQPRPMIIVTKEEIYLFQRVLDATTTPSLPVLTMRSPLYRHLPGAYTSPLSVYHRQCFNAQIPELGVFIIGSPAGRVGIFRLTRTRYLSEHSKEIFGFRLDHLLPLSKDKEAKYIVDDQWERQLVGLAVGPVQGMLDAGDGEEERDVGMRRWRLMLYYHDHTVHSYELGKYGGAGETRVDELMV